MKRFYCLLIFVAAGTLSVLSQCKSSYAHSPINQSSKQHDISYNINKIDSLNNIYLIYATRNDSLFKIISLNNKIYNCDKIKIGSNYRLNLQSRFKGEYAIKSNISDFNMKYNYYGTFVSLEKEKGIDDLFTTETLKGLCLNNY